MAQKVRVKKTSSIWLADENKKPIVSVNVSGVNLQGTGVTGFLMFKKETFQSIYTIDCKIVGFRWSVSKTFMDFIELFHTIHSNPFISAKKKLTCDLPQSEDTTNSDVMVLLERKDQLDHFLRELFVHLDPFLYTPLGKYLNLNVKIAPFVSKVVHLQRSIRKFLGKTNLNMMLLQYYSEELVLLSYALEEGVEVISYVLTQTQDEGAMPGRKDSPDGTSISLSGAPSPTSAPLSVTKEKLLLWLDVHPDDPALSRLCLVKKSVLDAFKHRHGKAHTHSLTEDRLSERLTDRMSNTRNSISVSRRSSRTFANLEDEDERLSKGIYASDIAEVRHGANSFVFRYVAAAQNKASGSESEEGDELTPSLCFSIIGSERTMDLQLTSPEYPSLLKQTNTVGGMRTEGSANRFGNKEQHKPSTWRDFLVDFLNLTSIHALYEDELALRSRKWIRYGVLEKLGPVPEHVNGSVAAAEASAPADFHPFSYFKLSDKKRSEGAKLNKLLSNSIIIDEELFSLEEGSYMISKRLHYKVAQNEEGGRQQLDGLFVEDPTEDNHSSTRMIYLHDISEIRPGKMSFAVDGEEFPLCLTIIGSETIITLPVNSIVLRDRLITRFQGILESHKRQPRGDSGYLVYAPPNNVSNIIIDRATQPEKITKLPSGGPHSSNESVFDFTAAQASSGTVKAPRLQVRRSINMVRCSDARSSDCDMSRSSSSVSRCNSGISVKDVDEAEAEADDYPDNIVPAGRARSESGSRNSSTLLED